MATIARTTKAGSGTGDFAAGTTIVASEANADINTIYNEFNGSIAAVNLASNAVTTTKILDENVTTDKIVIGGATPATATGAVTANLAISTVETGIASFTIVTRGGRVIATPATVLYLATATTGTGIITFRWKLAAVTFRTITILGGGVNPGVFPLPVPGFQHTPAAGSNAYILTGETSLGTLVITSTASNTGQIDVMELA